MLKYNKTIEQWEECLVQIESDVFSNYSGDDFEEKFSECFKPSEVNASIFEKQRMVDSCCEVRCETRILRSDYMEELGSIPQIRALSKRVMESFAERLIRMIDERGMKDPEVYKAANLSRQTFSKIKNGQSVPTKKTIFALALAMKLDLDDAEDLLRSAGYAIQDNSLVDLAVRYFIEHEMYDLMEDEEILYTCFKETLVTKE